MKSQFTKIAAAALAMSMCVPTAAFATGTTPPAINGETSGSFDTSFDVYSPALHISVPLKADVEVNPMADASNTGVKQFTVASNSIDIINASVDTEADAAIPVNVTVKATIASTAEGVVTEYNTFTADNTSTRKKINLNLTEAATAATLDIANAAADAADTKLTDLSKITIDNAAVYAGATNKTAVTKYGSLLSVDIAGPTSTETSGSFTTDVTKVTPGVGSFAVTGVANTNADWKADDVKVAITYNVKASQALSITTPAIATAPTFTSGASAADLTIVVPNVGEAEVFAVGCHNDNFYKDYNWDPEAYTVTYAPNATTTTQTDATITFKKDDAGLAFLTADEYSGKAQDLVIGLTDGRMVTSTLTVTKGN